MSFNLKLSHKVLLLVAVPLIFELGFLAVLNNLLEEAERERERESDARAIISLVNELHRIMIGQVAGFAAYSMLADERGMTRSTSITDDLARITPLMEQLVHDKPEELAHFQRARMLALRGSDQLRIIKRMFRQLGPAQIAQELKTVKPLLREVAAEMDAILAEERKIEAASPRRLAKNRTQVKQLLIIGVAVNMAMAIVLVSYFNRNVTARLAVLTDNSIRLAHGQPLNPPLCGDDELAHLDRVFKDMANALEIAARKERAVIENAADVIGSINEKGIITKISPASLRVLGFSPHELEGKHYLEIVLPEDAGATTKSFEEMREGRASQPFESRVRRRDGTVLNLLWSVHWSQPDASYFWVAHDITERKQAEDLLREAEARVRLILESLPVGLIIITPGGTVELINETMGEIFGIKKDDLLGQHIGSFLSGGYGSKSSAESDRLMNELLDKAVGRSYEATAVGKNGRHVPIEISLREIETVNGKRFLGLILDITERHEIERIKRDFVAMVSHDLKTPLTSVQNYLELLGQGIYGKITKAGLERLAALENSITRLVGLIRDLLDLDRWEAGHLQLRVTYVKVHDIIAQSLDAVRAPMEKKNIKLESRLTDLSIEADGDRLIQVLVNLLSNAIKFSPDAGVIRLLIEKNDSYVEFQVIDEGPGIPESHQNAIFDRFKQVSADDAHEKGGTGLGLAISKAIIEQHGGQIGVNSETGKGSTFWFRLPVEAKAAKEDLVSASDG
ncbi:MAG TPA: PAS domain S-box protein [Candidatus Obscuribacterales bacterium]